MSHKMSFNGKNLVRHGEVLPSVDLKQAADQFISVLRKLETDIGSKPILVCHGSEVTTLLNNFALVKCDEVLEESITG